MGKCVKCGTNFIGTAANPPGDGLCRYCEMDALRAKLDASERANAQMREALEMAKQYVVGDSTDGTSRAELAKEDLPLITRALSSDAGRDYVPRSEVEAAWRKGMTDAVGIVNGTFLGYNSQDGADMDFKAQAMTNIKAARDAKPTSALPDS